MRQTRSGTPRTRHGGTRRTIKHSTPNPHPDWTTRLLRELRTR